MGLHGSADATIRKTSGKVSVTDENIERQLLSLAPKKAEKKDKSQGKKDKHPNTS